MREHLKVDVALEIIASKIAEAIKNRYKELTDRYLQEREEIYLGNWEIIDKVLNYK